VYLRLYLNFSKIQKKQQKSKKMKNSFSKLSLKIKIKKYINRKLNSAISLLFSVTTGIQKKNMLYLAHDHSLLLVFSTTGKKHKTSPLKNVHRSAAPYLHRQTVPRIDNRNEKCLSIKSRSVARRCQTQQTMPPP
jgi:hypothetical protein